MKKENGANMSGLQDQIDQRIDKVVKPMQEGMVNQDNNVFNNQDNNVFNNQEKTINTVNQDPTQSLNENQNQPLVNTNTGIAQQNVNDFPMTNGTGSARPNFDQVTLNSIKKVNEGAPMANVLFKKK